MSTPPINIPITDPTDHPLAFDVNQAHVDSLTKTETICKRVSDWTGAPLALGLAIAIQAIWIPVGIITKLDPYPFAFLLTCSNVLQLILIFVLAVGQKQSASHAELRAEHDHDAISRLLYHQEVQEEVLIALARKIGVEVQNIEAMVTLLASEDKP
jgi:uncharacterized membrane protein